MASLVVGALPMALKPLTISPPNLSFSLSTASISLSPSPPRPFIYCGRGDKKTAKGKRFNHSFGNSLCKQAREVHARPRNKNKGRGPPRVPVTPAPPKKDRFDDNEKVKIEIDEF